jgi:SAM-dependent methyltransferase
VPAHISDHYSIDPESYFNEGYFRPWPGIFQAETARLKQLHPEAKTFLDIGAGIGKVMKAVDFDAYGIEPSEEFYRRAIDRMGISPERLFLTTVEEADFPRMFDIISFGVVLEHLYDPAAAIKKALTWLKPGGVIHVEVPNAEYMLSRLLNLYFWLCRTDYVVNISPMHVPFHLYEFTDRSFILHGRRTGYNVVHVDWYTGQAPYLTKFMAVLNPLMSVTKTGLGLVLYLRKADAGE